MDRDADHEILLEIVAFGASQQVRAISGTDGLEVSFVAPISAPRSEVEQLARAKLAFARRQRRPGPDGPEKSGPGKGGILA